MTDYLGADVEPLPQLALCRCGNSAIKPYCDGSHVNGFSDNKDPKRVADRRDTYDGQQLTIFDNRGICQHSGLCTDRLATVFRTGAEPFVAPSGGRMDEIIRAVRDCPSGALSYAIDGAEARGQVDWTATREPAIEVTRDGPYRVTGQIPLTGPAGKAEPRAEGSSREHYALCRCGHSQNKPFCSGMHWYVGFRDPVPGPGHEPTLFEWAGGLPGLSRMTRLLYEKHVPADPVLAPAFADMPADQPLLLARWLAAALGGPAGAGQDGDLRTAGFAPPGQELTAEQRTRWAALADRAADEAGLPADPGFRSAFAGCLEWGSRAAAQPAGPGGRAGAPVAARWEWGPGGPPQAPDDQAPAGVQLPGPGDPVSFAAHIRPLFTQRDRQSMSFAFDLWSADDVRAHAADILARIEDGSMPCDGAWPPDRIDVLRRWNDAGQPP
jgi:CDGSH-type Zn-finger protein/truncated hemoglobin YjbI